MSDTTTARTASDHGYTTDDIVCAIRIRGVSPSAAVLLLADGRLINRFREPHWPRWMAPRVDQWIDRNADRIRRQYLVGRRAGESA